MRKTYDEAAIREIQAYSDKILHSPGVTTRSFLISRIMEEYEKTGDNDRSTAEELQKTGSLITSAAFILIVVVGSFIFLQTLKLQKRSGSGSFPPFSSMPPASASLLSPP